LPRSSYCTLHFALCALHVGLWAAAGGLDGNFRWQRVRGVGKASRVFPSAADPFTVFVWTRGGLMLSKDEGRTFAARSPSAAAQLGSVTALLVSPVEPNVLYAGTAARGVFASADEGATWRPLGGTDKGLAHAHIHSMAFHPSDPTFTTLFATHSKKLPGISMTFDGGETWRAFARDFGADSLIVFGTHILFGGAHPAGGEQTGFYRSLDAGRNWFRILNVENPTVLLASKTAPHSAWFGTATNGLHFTENVGVSTKAVGPRTGVNVASLTVGFHSPTGERVCIYDPTGEGVLGSTDGFASWQKLNDGLYVGAWAAEGAMMAASPDGSTLYACVNGALYRGAEPQGTVLLSLIRVEPAAVVAGEGIATVTCRAAKGAQATIDLSAIGGSASVPLRDDGKSGDGAADDGLFGARLEMPEKVLSPPKDYKGPPLPGQIALPVRATRGETSETGHAIVHVLANPTDRVLWDGEAHDASSAWCHDGVSIRRSQEQPLSGNAHVRIAFTRAGQGGFGWKASNSWWDGDDTRGHKLFCFYIRSDKEGPTDLELALRDDGRKYGHAEGGRSNELPLSRYLPRLTTKYQFVAIPMADFILGSGALPEGICELVFVAPSNQARAYDVDDIGLAVRTGPRLSSGQVVLRSDGKSARLNVRVSSSTGKIASAVARVGEQSFPLHDDGRHDDEEADDGYYGAVVPASQLGAGLRTVRFVAQGAKSARELAVRVFLPRRPPGYIPRAGGEVKCDGVLSEFQDVVPFVLSQGSLSAKARILLGAQHLYFALEVEDPHFVPSKPDAKPDALGGGSTLEVLITSPAADLAVPRATPSAADHLITFGLDEKRAWATLRGHRWHVAGEKRDGGYLIEAPIPLDKLQAGNRRCDFAVGKSTRIELRLTGGNDTQLVWAAASPKASGNPENWGLAYFTEEAGAPQVHLERCDDRTLKLVSNKRLDQALARSTSSYEIPGVSLVKAEVAGDGRIVLLTAAQPWKTGQRVTVRFPGLRAADGTAAKGPLEFTVLPGMTLAGELLQEFLIGEVRTHVDPKAALQEDYVLGKEVRPAVGGQWKLVQSESGLVRLLDAVGRLENSIVHAHAYLFSDTDRTVQLWLGSDDGIKVTVNGETLYTDPMARGADSRKIKSVPLKRGWNTLLLGISQGGGDWNFCVRIMDDEGEPTTGVSYSAHSPFGPAKPPDPVRVAEASTGEVTVEKVDYLGWRDAWRVRSKACELVVVPQIGRVVHFSLRGGENVLYVNQGLVGRVVPKDDGQWHNFGGDKIWPTAQNLWEKYTGRKGWPPPYYFDCAPARVEPIKGGVRLRTPLSPHFGARCVREFVMDPQRPLVRVRQFHEKTEGNPAEMTLWSIAQVRKPVFALLPLKGGAQEARYRPLGKLVQPLFVVHKSVLSLRNDEAEGQKVGVVPDAEHRDGWVAAAYDSLLFVQSHKLEQGAGYPDGGCHAELFAAAKALGHYVELELLSPLRELKAGEKLRDDAVWQLIPLTAGQVDDPERLAPLARQAHEAALEALARP